MYTYSWQTTPAWLFFSTRKISGPDVYPERGYIGLTDFPQFLQVIAWIVHKLGYGRFMYEGWNFNSGNYLFTTDTK